MTTNALPTVTPYEPVSWVAGGLRLLDQTLLPHAIEYREIDSLESAVEAIVAMRVRGAPAIGIAAAYALAQAIRDDGAEAAPAAAADLANARPTAVNLRWAIDRVMHRIEGAGDAAEAALGEARAIHEQQRAADELMAGYGASLLGGTSTVLTHCNTGPLATGGGGTALGVAIEAHRRGLVEDVLVDETRPRLQGARLTTWELEQHSVPHRLITDSSAAIHMAAGRVSAVLTGADRIAANGDTANKVGTYALAIVAKHHDVPFYVVAPISTIDANSPDGRAIPIEERDASEVTTIGGETLVPDATRAANPAFDVTPASLITAIVTELGVLSPAYKRSIEDALELAGSGVGT